MFTSETCSRNQSRFASPTDEFEASPPSATAFASQIPYLSTQSAASLPAATRSAPVLTDTPGCLTIAAKAAVTCFESGSGPVEVGPVPGKYDANAFDAKIATASAGSAAIPAAKASGIALTLGISLFKTRASVHFPCAGPRTSSSQTAPSEFCT